MRIGIEARALVPAKMAGISTYLDKILQYIGEHDKENEYILYSWQPFEKEHNYGPNFTFRLVPATRGLLWSVLVLPKAVKEDNLDVFWGPSHELPLLPKHVKGVLTIHDLALLINPKWGEKRHALAINLLMPGSVRRADKVVAISQSTKRDLKRILRARDKKISVIYEGGYEDQTHLVSAQGLAAAKEKYGIGDKYFFFVGTIEPRKNISTLVQAFELLATKDPAVQLVIAGGIGWRCADVLQQMENSPFADRILRVGYVDKQEKLDLYSGAVAYVLPSHYEGFGLPVLEAMSLGGIVITANNSSLPEVGGEAAFYVEDENNAADLAAKMEQVLTLNAAQRQQRIALGVAQAAKFSWEKCAKETAELLLGCVNK